MLRLVEESVAYDFGLKDKTRWARTCREAWATKGTSSGLLSRESRTRREDLVLIADNLLNQVLRCDQKSGIDADLSLSCG